MSTKTGVSGVQIESDGGELHVSVSIVRTDAPRIFQPSAEDVPDDIRAALLCWLGVDDGSASA